ncbi:MAG: SBBP repeat-containing protein [Actinomycetota bacterium]|nr:SBBP repeat-containing protein [Actinomycetota bacterium]
MYSPIALGRLPMPAVALATALAIAAALVLVALGEGGVPTTLDHSSGTATTEKPAPAPAFEQNRGQAGGEVEYLARGSGYTLFLTPTEAVLSLQAGEPGTTTLMGDGSLTRGTGMEADGAVVRMGLAGASSQPEIAGRSRKPATASYIRGDDPSKWRTGVPTFGRVQYTGVYPGIDMAWYGNSAGLEYDFEVAAGADPSRIGLTFEGAEGVSVGSAGELVVRTAAGDLSHQRPFAYQETNGVRERVEAGYVLRRDGSVGFELGSYDRAKPLVIDPQIVYSTYIGGNRSDRGADVAVDGAGNAYIVGSTESPDFPTTSGAFRTSAPGGDSDVFVSKLSQDGSTLEYSTYLGTGGQDFGHSIAVNGDGHAFVTGKAAWGDFPTTPGAFRETDPSSTADLFVAKLSTDGSSLDYGTYLGSRGVFDDFGAVAIDADGSAYVAGTTDGDNWPTTPGAFQSSDPEPGPPASGFDGYVTKLTPDGSGLEWSSYLGGPTGHGGPQAIAVEGENAYVTGTSNADGFPTTPGAYRETAPSPGQESDAFVAKFATDGSKLEYGTYLGGNTSDNAHGIDVRDGVAYVGGFTGSDNFPTTSGSFQPNDPQTGNSSSDGFVTALKPDGSGLEYSTYLGGPQSAQWAEGVLALTVDSDGRAIATGRTDSRAFPTTPGAFQETDPDTTYEDAYVAMLNPGGSKLEYGTYLGGISSAAEMGSGIALDGAGEVYVGGLTNAGNFPTTEGAYQTTNRGQYDAFVTKVHPERKDPAATPAALELAPDVAVNTVGTTHCVTATVTDQNGAAFEGATVRFSVSGSVSESGSAATGADGQAQFCYSGPAFPGDDVIEAYADSDDDGTRDEGEPGDGATKQWVLASSTDACKVTGGGTITAANGDRATFGGIARSYVDHGPAQPLGVRSTRVLALVCSEDRRSAVIFGEATVDGGGTVMYRVDVTDGGEPSAADSYGMLLASGYASGAQALRDGNVQVR